MDSSCDPRAAGDAEGLTGVDESFGIRGPVGEWSPDVDPLPPGSDLGGVSIVRLIARGGMGRVYEGVQAAPRRRVAVKLLAPFGLGPEGLRRFEHEAAVLARLRHPSIAQIHTFGSCATAAGAVPFFVMELVPDARPITRFCAAEELGVHARVALFRSVCQAIGHAHAAGIVHRDLKPGNILVGADGTAKVIDFGVARSTASPDDAVSATTTGALVGTLQYMSPEQLGAAAGRIDPRTDIYQLGLVLHEMLVGSLPYEVHGLPIAAVVGLVEGGGRHASAAVARAAGRECGHDEARALGAVVATCLDPEPGQRYATADELDADLGRWLDGRPVAARPPTWLESARRFARRHRAATLAGVSVLAALVVASAVIGVFAVRSERLRRDAERQATVARDELAFSTLLLAAEARDRDHVAEARRLLDTVWTPHAARGLAPTPEITCLAGSLDDAERVIAGFDGGTTAVAWSPDGGQVAVGEVGGAVRVQRVGDAEDRGILLGRHDAEVWAIAFSPDGRWLVSASGDRTACVWDAGGVGPRIRLEGHEGPVYGVAVAPDGGTVATASRDGTVRLWSTTDWRPTGLLRGHAGSVYAVRYAPDGSLLATASLDRTARLWTAAGEPRATLVGHAQRVFHVAFAPDGGSVATASADGTARVWDVATGDERRRFTHPSRVNATVFCGAGGRLATASGDDVLRIWDVERAAETARLRGHAGPLAAVDRAASDGRLATAAADGTVRLWRGDGLPAGSRPEGGRVLAAACSPDGRRLALALGDGRVILRDAGSLERLGAIDTRGGRVNAVAFSTDGRTLAAATDDGRATLWDAHSLDLLRGIDAHRQRVYSVAFSPDGGRLATASEDRTVRVWDVATAAAVADPLRHPRRVFCAAWSPAGDELATACEDRLVRLWDPLAPAERLRLAGHTAQVNWVAYTADGAGIGSASSDATVRLWWAASGEPRAVLTGPARQIWKCAFSPDGTRVAAVSADGTGQLWGTASGRAACLLRGHADQVWAVAFTAAGDGVITGSWDGTSRLWGGASYRDR